MNPRDRIAELLYGLRVWHPEMDTQGLVWSDCEEVADEILKALHGAEVRVTHTPRGIRVSDFPSVP